MKFSKLTAAISLVGLLLGPGQGLAVTTASQSLPLPPPRWAQQLNQITLQLSVEQWVETKTARVTVGINAALNNNQLAQIHQQILQQLNSLSATDWHITSFNRSQDQSGLEQLDVQAEARLPEAKLADIRAQAKAISKPGETFTINSIDFVPTLAEIEAARASLRAQLYAAIKNEVTEINNIYPNQKYFVHRIDFIEPNAAPIGPVPMPRMMVMAANTAPAAGAPLTVSNKLVLNAYVVLAAQLPSATGQ